MAQLPKLDNAATKEQLRQQYLTSMGIMSWFPVKPLPHAANGQSWSWRAADAEATATDSEPVTTTAQSAAPAPNASSAADILAGIRAPQTAQPVSDKATAEPAVSKPAAPAPAASGSTPPVVAPQQPEPVASSGQGKADKAPVPRFRLWIVAYDDCLVINEMPLESNQIVSDAQLNLLRGIVAAIGLGKGLEKQTGFAWPVVNNPKVDHGAHLARMAVAGKVATLSPQKVPVIALGDAALEFGLPGFDTARMAEVQRVDERLCITGASLNALMGIPELKRELWQALQQLSAQMPAPTTNPRSTQT